MGYAATKWPFHRCTGHSSLGRGKELDTEELRCLLRLRLSSQLSSQSSPCFWLPAGPRTRFLGLWLRPRLRLGSLTGVNLRRRVEIWPNLTIMMRTVLVRRSLVAFEDVAYGNGFEF